MADLIHRQYIPVFDGSDFGEELRGEVRHVIVGDAASPPLCRPYGLSLLRVSALRAADAIADSILPLSLGFIAGVLAVVVPCMVIAEWVK